MSTPVQPPSDGSPPRIVWYAWSVAGACLCAFLLWHWGNALFPTSARGWDPSRTITALLVVFAPLAMMASALLPGVDAQTSHRWVRRIIMAHAALAFGLSPVACGAGMAGYDVGIGLGVFAFFAGCIDALVLTTSPYRDAPRDVVRVYRWSLLSLAAAVPLWSFANIGIVAWQATRIAGDEPYCLQVQRSVRGGGYKPLESILGMNGLVMRAVKGRHLYMSYHAVLVVGTGRDQRMFNWSYRRQSFMPARAGDYLALSDRPACDPRPSFLSSLPLIASRSAP